MGGINSACLKPRSMTSARARASICRDGNDEKKEPAKIDDPNTTRDSTTTTTTTTTTSTMKNGDVVVIGGGETKAKQKRKSKKRRELSHAFQLPAFQSQDSVSNDGSKERSSLQSSDGVGGVVVVVDDDDVEEAHRINVNNASVEELMTLAGVTRPLAENLVRHRQRIGGFRYLEDVAIVNGFGAAKLNLIKDEIKLGSGNNSRNSSPNARPSRARASVERRISSSCSPSLLNFDASARECSDPALNALHHSSPVKNSPLPPFKPLKPSSGRVSDDPKTHRRSASGASGVSRYLAKSVSRDTPSLVDVNAATVFQLMTVPGLSQALAQKIFVYRNRFGPFSSVRDLLRVKGVKANWLDGVQPYLTVLTDSGGGNSWASLVSDVEATAGGGSQKDDSGICDAACKSSSKEEYLGDKAASEMTPYSAAAAPRRGIESSSSLAERAKAALSSRPLSTSIVDTYLPFIEKSLRPDKPPVDLKRDNKEVFRIASWNLQSCGNDKASNIGVTEIVCMTILEAGLAIVGFQDLRDVHVVEHLCSQLNQPTLPAVSNWPGSRGQWKNCVSHARDCRLVGFMYDASQRVKLTKSHDYNCPLGGAIVSRATFRVGLKLKAFSVINAHFYTHDADKLLSAFSTLRDAMNESARATKNAPCVVISSVASPRKSSYSWGILGLSSLLSHDAAQFAAGGKKPAAAAEENRDDGENAGRSSQNVAADRRDGSPVSLLRVRPSDVQLSELLRFSVSTPHSPKRGELPAATPDGGGGVETLSRDLPTLFAALETLAQKNKASLKKTASPPEANIFMDVKSSTLHSGHGEVVEEGLSSPWIPEDWAWGGGVSPFRPVWAEFFKEFKSVEVLNRRSRFRSSLPVGGGGSLNVSRRFGFVRGKKKEWTRPTSVLQDRDDEGIDIRVERAGTDAAAAATGFQREKNVINVRSASSFFNAKVPGLSKPKATTTASRGCDTQILEAAGSADSQQPSKLFSNAQVESAIIEPVVSSNLILIDQHANSLPNAAYAADEPIVTHPMQEWTEYPEQRSQASSSENGVRSTEKEEESTKEKEEEEEEGEEGVRVMVGSCEILSKSYSSDNATFFTCNSDFSSAEED